MARFLSVQQVLFGIRKYCTIKFSKSHEWLRKTSDNEVVVGVSSYAQETLGELVYIELPEVGCKLSMGQECGTLESVKAASELYSPVTGLVTEKNVQVEKTPDLVNRSCYEEGWLFKLKLREPKELEKLMTENQYEEFKKSIEH